MLLLMGKIWVNMRRMFEWGKLCYNIEGGEGENTSSSDFFERIYWQSTCQFHQHFSSAFAPIYLRQKNLTYTSSTKKLLRKTCVQKGASKILVKLTLLLSPSLRQKSKCQTKIRGVVVMFPFPLKKSITEMNCIFTNCYTVHVWVEFKGC